MRKRGTFGIDEKILITVVRAAELFKRRSSALFAAHGLSFSQYNALRVLEIAPEGRQSISGLSRQMLVSSPNLSGIAKRLEKAGFVQRLRDAGDERRTLLEITPQGLAVLARIEAAQRDNIRDLLAPCPAARKAEVLAILKAILALDLPGAGAGAEAVF